MFASSTMFLLILHCLVVKGTEDKHESKPLAGGEGVEVDDAGEEDGEDLPRHHYRGEEESSEFL